MISERKTNTNRKEMKMKTKRSWTIIVAIMMLLWVGFWTGISWVEGRLSQLVLYLFLGVFWVWNLLYFIKKEINRAMSNTLILILQKQQEISLQLKGK